jgi:flagellar basal-body rod protein FlgG
MIKGIRTSGLAMPPMTVRLEVIANNLANVNTSGFKRDSMFVQMMKDSSAVVSPDNGELTGTKIGKVTDFGEGSLNQTNNPLDLALQGEGFFVVRTPQGMAYTRNGNFSLALDGTLVTAKGHPVMGSQGPIKMPDAERVAQGSLAVSPTGEVTVGGMSIGKIRIVNFADPLTMKKNGDSFFADETGASPAITEVETPIIRQGFLEESNVEGIAEMAEMIELTRNFESNQKAIQSQDATLDRANEVGRL